MQVGFWEGKSMTEICREITSHREIFWDSHPYECLELVERKFGSFLGTVEVVLYFYLMCMAARYAWERCVRPKNPIVHLYVPYNKKDDAKSGRDIDFYSSESFTH
jgi:hypothetical protein